MKNRGQSYDLMFFHTMENLFALFPRYGKKFSTLWKTFLRDVGGDSPPAGAALYFARERAVEPRTTSEVGRRSLHSVISPLMSCKMRLQDSMPTW